MDQIYVPQVSITVLKIFYLDFNLDLEWEFHTCYYKKKINKIIDYNKNVKTYNIYNNIGNCIIIIIV